MAKRSTGGKRCSVAGCGNYDNRDKQCSYFSFPNPKYYAERKRKWEEFCGRERFWTPSKSAVICSEHFVDGRKGNHPDRPGFFPTIKKWENTVTVMAHSLTSHVQPAAGPQVLPPTGPEVSPPAATEVLLAAEPEPQPKTTIEVMSVGLCSDDDDDGGMFFDDLPAFPPSPPKESPEDSPETPPSPGVAGSDPQRPEYSAELRSFLGEETISQYLAIPDGCFSLCVAILEACGYKPRSHAVDYFLFVTLFKLRHNNDFSILSLLFKIKPSTLTLNFKEIMEILGQNLDRFIYWPTKEEIKSQLPEAFREKYPDCRVIVDCTEIETEKVKELDVQNAFYSSYKSCHTVKLLIAISPSGVITFISKAYGGKASDTFITNDCGILDLLETGDQFMADKGFPEVINDRPDVVTVIPPRKNASNTVQVEVEVGKVKKRKKTIVQYTDLANEQTQSIASVRIHVERVIQRLKQFKILSHKLSADLLHQIK